jgi:hypothetical protein
LLVDILAHFEVLADCFCALTPSDFGMAVFFTEGKLPLKDLGLEGTPW